MPTKVEVNSTIGALQTNRTAIVRYEKDVSEYTGCSENISLGRDKYARNLIALIKSYNIPRGIASIPLNPMIGI